MSKELISAKLTPYGVKYRPPKGLVGHVKRAGLHGIRAYGTLTSPLRELPDYLIIGTKRGGSTSIARWLTEHPDVSSLFPKQENRKGIYFFDVNYSRGVGWYKSHFPTRHTHALKATLTSSPQLLGDSTPYYLYHPHAAERAAALVPDAKVIALLRNPIDRAYGHWKERVGQGVENLSLLNALQAEQQRCDGEESKMIDDPTYVSFSHQHYSYVDQGRYAKSLKRWMKHYDNDQLLVLKAEDMYANPSETYRIVTDHLCLKPFELEEFAAHNKVSKPDMEPEARAYLREQLADDIAELEELLDRKMEWL